MTVAADAQGARGTVARLRLTLEMIRFSHSVFALPFALLALVIASEGWPRLSVLLWVLVAMVAARSAAMGVNRIVDRRFDAENPRTAKRHLVVGSLSLRYAVVFTGVCCALFLLAAAMLNRTALMLAPFVLAVLLAYSFLKRVTSLAHLGVGLALGLSPLGAWVAGYGGLGGDLLVPLLLGGAVMFWVAGFDVIYAGQDIDVDRKLGLRSLPAQLGLPRALHAAAGMHVACLALFAAVAWRARLAPLFPAAVVLAALLLLRVHHLARRADSSQANAALLPLNGVVALVLGAAGIVDRLVS